ncbi:hypothetical protein APHAL10511_003994 [Amanita phalloides]|nr:hypothetical protein APHAL10511_003994 [Amanita phalloides]
MTRLPPSPPARSEAAEPVFAVRLLAALRSGDPSLIHPFVAEIGKDKRTPTDDAVDTAAAALHLAIRCASADTVALLLSHRAISPNGVHPPASGTTALHLAASLRRTDVVRLLLDHPDIDDSLFDAQGRSCKDLAKSKDVVHAIDDSRSLLNATFRSQLHSYILSPPSANQSPLVALLDSPRAKFIDLSYLDQDSGTALLHEAARKKDLRLIELAVRAGADVFVRNRKGKTAYEGAGKDDPVRVFLRQYANHDNTLIHTSPNFNQLPTLKGYLNKYTNVAKGYSTRWFVLRGGILSYYRNQADETVTSRGSISLKNAILRSTGDKLRFEVHSVPAAAHYSAFHEVPSANTASSSSSGQKWYIKANHPVEVARWMQAIERSVQYFARERDDLARRKSGESDSSYRASPTISSSSKILASSTSQTLSSFPGATLLKKAAKTSGSVVREVRDSLSRGDLNARSISISSGQHVLRDSISSNAAEMVHSFEPIPGSPSIFSGGGADEDEEEGPGCGEEETEDNVSSTADSLMRDAKEPPYEPGFALHANSVTAQLELIAQLVAGMGSVTGTGTMPAITRGLSYHSQSSSLPSSVASASTSPSSASSMSLPLKHQQQLHAALADSLTGLSALVHEYIKMVSEREIWLRRRLGEEQGRQRVWEESLKVVVKEGEDLERELRARSRKRGSTFLGMPVSPTGGRRLSIGGIAWGNPPPPETDAAPSPLSQVPEMLETQAPQPQLPQSQPPQPRPPQSQPPQSQSPQSQPPQSQPQPSPALEAGQEVRPNQDRAGIVPSSTITLISSPAGGRTIPQPRGSLSKQSRRSSISSSHHTTDEEDEFFDAIESNNLPNLVVHSSFTPARPAAVLPFQIDLACYTGYTQLRTQLSISADNRPSTSLWSVLKHSIGKDLTRISFPVFFNEPTSMLQRMAEDMEFSECLDAAARESDPLRRIAYVAAFAISNYSSTIGRIAKPFNPMLSETFEYVRLDKQYRYISEQVSHHPPISACWAESPLWSYYGEVDAQNRFMGKSFEIRPTGIAHVELLLPKALGPSYPKASGAHLGVGRVKEHYTWKKVTTNVSGFILGSPTIDHYGNMEVRNHRTGDRCVLTFKPRGWRGKDAFEITGRVLDARGRAQYEIAGRWNSQLVARRCVDDDDEDEDGNGNGNWWGNGTTLLHPDTPVQGGSPEFILLWRNSEKPPGMPFNLTPFAITLNDCPRDALRPYLAPTDCRLRPDQRAFELGQYELANTLKTMQEDKQRAVRRAREEGRVPPHRPRWFMAETDGDTGERVWNPVMVGGMLEYWVERERVTREGGTWKDVERIFIDEPESIRGW